MFQKYIVKNYALHPDEDNYPNEVLYHIRSIDGKTELIVSGDALMSDDDEDIDPSIMIGVCT